MVLLASGAVIGYGSAFHQWHGTPACPHGLHAEEAPPAP